MASLREGLETRQQGELDADDDEEDGNLLMKRENGRRDKEEVAAAAVTGGVRGGLIIAFSLARSFCSNLWLSRYIPLFEIAPESFNTAVFF